VELKGNEMGTDLTFSRERCGVQILRGEDPDRQSRRGVKGNAIGKGITFSRERCGVQVLLKWEKSS